MGRVFDELRVNGHRFLQQWGIELDLKRERLDMSRYSREFTEYTSA